MPDDPDHPEPVSRRARPAKAPLSRDAIVRAALSLIESGGEHVTLRRLATELDTGPASLYVYFRNGDELNAAVLDHLLGTITLRRGRKPWRDRLTALLVAYTEVLYAQPSLARTALVTRPSGPNSLDIWEAVLALLHEGDVPLRNAAWGADLLIQRATATAVEAATRSEKTQTAADDARLADAILAAPADTHPHLAAASAEVLGGAYRTRLTWGFEALITGIAAIPPAAD